MAQEVWLEGRHPGDEENYSGTQEAKYRRAIVSGKLTDMEAMDKFQISRKTVQNWKELYSAKNDELYLSNHLHVRNKKSKKVQPDIPADEVSQLRQELADARLKIAALDTLIDVAEDQLKINIRKKPGARQSSK